MATINVAESVPIRLGKAISEWPRYLYHGEYQNEILLPLKTSHAKERHHLLQQFLQLKEAHGIRSPDGNSIFFRNIRIRQTVKPFSTGLKILI